MKCANGLIGQCASAWYDQGFAYNDSNDPNAPNDRNDPNNPNNPNRWLAHTPHTHTHKHATHMHTRALNMYNTHTYKGVQRYFDYGGAPRVERGSEGADGEGNERERESVCVRESVCA